MRPPPPPALCLLGTLLALGAAETARAGWSSGPLGRRCRKGCRSCRPSPAAAPRVPQGSGGPPRRRQHPGKDPPPPPDGCGRGVMLSHTPGRGLVSPPPPLRAEHGMGRGRMLSPASGRGFPHSTGRRVGGASELRPASPSPCGGDGPRAAPGRRRRRLPGAAGPGAGAGAGVGRLRLLFTPPRCRGRCAGARCAQLCPPGKRNRAGERPRGRDERLPPRHLPTAVPERGGLRPPRLLPVPPRLRRQILPPPRRRHRGGPPKSGGAPGPHPLRLHPAPGQPPRGGGWRPVHGQHPRAAPTRSHGRHPPRGAGAGGGGGGGGGPPPGTQSPPGTQTPPYRVLAQAGPRVPPGEEGAGYGYCFRLLRGGECSSPLPGLRTQDVCCRGAGVAWGVRECQPCDGPPRQDTDPPQRDAPCPQGFRSVNGSCRG
ncbi:uncharacterized protein LOC142365380 [Opisthocomus hoazin]|uniref:uncharacterized protein LOC142365380 n=1 Tax=Opisthocomus hoazin TaxID=30419 RepID=UPI003F534EC6